MLSGYSALDARQMAIGLQVMHHVQQWSAVVMPCLNEQDNLAAACGSLGFGGVQGAPERCLLVLVDNGSTDATLDICEGLRSDVGDVVKIARELVRGHVPARHCGNVEVAHFADANGISVSEFIIVQADADTQYSPRYVDRMREAISSGPAGTSSIGQAVSQLLPTVRAEHPCVFAAVDLIDEAVESRFGSSQYDVIIDDKACAYWLGDYEQWGGHRREYFRDGGELLAETTRLAIAGLTHGATRIDVADASVIHSQRRLLGDAVQELAAAGFPYAGRRIFAGILPVTLDDLERRVVAGDRKLLDAIVAARASHLIALLVLLPAHLARVLTGEVPGDSGLEAALERLPRRSILEAAKTPGRLLNDVLDLALTSGLLLDLLDRAENGPFREAK
jgi:hypothetical protein